MKKAKRILVIPHALNHPVRVREVEIASALANRGHEVTLLTERSQPAGLSLFGKIAYHLGNLRAERLPQQAGLTALRLPRKAFRTPSAIAYNRQRLDKLLKSEAFDAVINAGYSLDQAIEPPKGCTYLLDIVDDHLEGARMYGDPAEAEKVDRFYRQEIPKASRVIVVSEALKRVVRQRWKAEAEIIPNGVNRDAFRWPDRERAEELRQEFGIAPDRFVFGYIGGMDRFIDVNTVNDAFLRVRRRFPKAALLWIGGGERYAEHAAKKSWLETHGIHFAGPVAQGDAPSAVSLFNVGLIPKVVSPFTDAMMPIKALEYGVAKLPVVSSPLGELSRLKFPNVELVPLYTDAWENAMVSAIESRAGGWDLAWNAVFDGYGWESVAWSFEIEAFFGHANPSRQ